MHIYVCQAWKQVPILLCLERLLDGQRADVVKQTIISTLDLHGGVMKKELSERLVCFGADGDSLFQGCNTRISVQLKTYNAPYMFGVHCMAYRTNMAVQILSNLPLVAKVETLCERLYNYFTISPKRHLEFTNLPITNRKIIFYDNFVSFWTRHSKHSRQLGRIIPNIHITLDHFPFTLDISCHFGQCHKRPCFLLVDVMETGSLKLLRNVKTQWILVLEPLKCILQKYKTLIVKMGEDAAVKNLNAKDKEASTKVRNNLDLLYDVETLLALSCLILLLEPIESLIKFAQSSKVCVSDYVAIVKIYQVKIYMMYIDPNTSLMEMFCNIIEDSSYAIQLEWLVDLNNGNESLFYCMLGHTYATHSLNPLLGEKDVISMIDFAQIVAGVKGQCTSAAKCSWLNCLDDSDLMNALGIILPQFWLQLMLMSCFLCI